MLRKGGQDIAHSANQQLMLGCVHPRLKVGQ